MLISRRDVVKQLVYSIWSSRSVSQSSFLQPDCHKRHKNSVYFVTRDRVRRGRSRFTTDPPSTGEEILRLPCEKSGKQRSSAQNTYAQQQSRRRKSFSCCLFVVDVPACMQSGGEIQDALEHRQDAGSGAGTSVRGTELLGGVGRTLF